MTVEELGERMTAIEFAKWMALYQVEGQEQERAMKQAKSGKGAA